MERATEKQKDISMRFVDLKKALILYGTRRWRIRQTNSNRPSRYQAWCANFYWEQSTAVRIGVKRGDEPRYKGGGGGECCPQICFRSIRRLIDVNTRTTARMKILKLPSSQNNCFSYFLYGIAIYLLVLHNLSLINIFMVK